MKKEDKAHLDNSLIELKKKYQRLGLELIIQSILKDYFFEKSQGSGIEIEEFVDSVITNCISNPTEEIKDAAIKLFLAHLRKIYNSKRESK